MQRLSQFKICQVLWFEIVRQEENIVRTNKNFDETKSFRSFGISHRILTWLARVVLIERRKSQADRDSLDPPVTHLLSWNTIPMHKRILAATAYQNFPNLCLRRMLQILYRGFPHRNSNSSNYETVFMSCRKTFEKNFVGRYNLTDELVIRLRCYPNFYSQWHLSRLKSFPCNFSLFSNWISYDFVRGYPQNVRYDTKTFNYTRSMKFHGLLYNRSCTSVISWLLH